MQIPQSSSKIGENYSRAVQLQILLRRRRLEHQRMTFNGNRMQIYPGAVRDTAGLQLPTSLIPV